MVLLNPAAGQKPENVLIVANRASPVSKAIAEYYARKRGIPSANVCYLDTPPTEHIAREVFNRDIAAPLAKFLARNRLTEQILYIATTLGVPLGILGGQGQTADAAAVDSELTMLYTDLRGKPHAAAGPIQNPFYARRDAKFEHPAFPIYLVTRLAGYDFADVRGLIDRSLLAVNRGKVVLDQRSLWEEGGDDWLHEAAIRLPQARVVLDESPNVLLDQAEVIGYASWGSNDKNRTQRLLHFQWLPGAIMTEYVSTNGRTFERPPDAWTISTWKEQDKLRWWKGSPQSLTADYIHEGATGASGHVYEPYLKYCPRPELLFPAYLKGRTLAESYYLSIPALSWMNIVVGDPLCRLR